VDQLNLPAAEQETARDEEHIGSVVHKGCECRIDLAAATGFEHLDSQSCSAGSVL
jgi:hypothetical protein